jgi:hypothetical protein
MVISMAISIVLEKRTHYLASERKRLFWSIDSAGPQARLLILKNASQINRFTYLIYAISATLSIVLLPVFGSHREWFIAEYVFDRYFGSSSNVLYHVTFSFAPFCHLLINSSVWLLVLHHIAILLANVLDQSTYFTNL